MSDVFGRRSKQQLEIAASIVVEGGEGDEGDEASMEEASLLTLLRVLQKSSSSRRPVRR